MNLSETNQWLSLSANLAVLAGIAFLIIELNQNTEAIGVSDITASQEIFQTTNSELIEYAHLDTRANMGETLEAHEEFQLQHLARAQYQEDAR